VLKQKIKVPNVGEYDIATMTKNKKNKKHPLCVRKGNYDDIVKASGAIYVSMAHH
jgi:hypothetical protein